LASAGLSFGAEKALKKIFGNGYGKGDWGDHDRVRTCIHPLLQVC
jgi:hypothetical protein